ncbi:MAG: hypothetical protein DHS20C10_04810 [marine bacterium B5-7]|nr:MAG: hypothetical protein DHS20C10_04810 [marine bacterium B5-7]
MYCSAQCIPKIKGSEIKIYKTKNFVRWARKEKLSDGALKKVTD